MCVCVGVCLLLVSLQLFWHDSSVFSVQLQQGQIPSNWIIEGDKHTLVHGIGHCKGNYFCLLRTLTFWEAYHRAVYSQKSVTSYSAHRPSYKKIYTILQTCKNELLSWYTTVRGPSISKLNAQKSFPSFYRQITFLFSPGNLRHFNC